MLALLFLLFAQQQSSLQTEFQHAQQEMAAGHFREAIPLYTDLVHAMPGNAKLLMNLGVAQHMANQPDPAVKSLEAAVKLDPNLFPANLYLGFAYITIGQPARAIPPLRQALALEPGQKGALLGLSEALFRTEDFSEAATELRKLTASDPTNAHAWFLLGRSLDQIAATLYHDLLARASPDSPYALSVTADRFLHTHQPQKAFTNFREALSKDPQLVTAHVSIADLYAQLGHPDWAKKERAEATFTDCATRRLACDWMMGRYESLVAATANPQTPAALYWRAQAFSGMANEVFKNLQTLPPSSEFFRYKAGLDYEAGRNAEVIEDLRKASELAPDDLEIKRDLAQALGSARDFSAAYQIASELLRNDPQSPELNALVGSALLEIQHPEEAVPYLSRALAQDSHNSAIQGLLGRAYVQTGAFELAIAHLEAAAHSDTDGSIHYQLALAYRHTGKRVLAQQAMAQYQKLSSPAPAPPSAITAP